MNSWLTAVLLATAAAVSAASLVLDDSDACRRQTIDGFGGSIAFWGTHADDEALEAAISGLQVSILRAQGEVSPSGEVEHNRDILQRAMRLNPELQVLLTFWQPKSAAAQGSEHWLTTVKIDGNDQFVIRPEMVDAWGEELVGRVQLYQSWGVNVTCIGVQNESNWSHPGTQTCRWEPEQLRSFVEDGVVPRLKKAGIHAAVAAPDLAYIGYQASEVQRFLPLLKSDAVDIVAYHMYDSYKGDMDGSLVPLQRNSQALAVIYRQHLPGKKLWMTETTGAQWNSDVWHTYGWSPELSEHDKAIKAARYIHMTLVDAEANAFLWWGLLYSLAPDNEKNPQAIQKHRDEGLVLVSHNTIDGRQAFVERTKKYYAFRQYSAFVRPGFRRLQVQSPPNVQVSAFVSPDSRRLVVVAINDMGTAENLTLQLPAGKTVTGAWQTDAERNCDSVDSQSPLAAKSVRTWVIE